MRWLLRLLRELFGIDYFKWFLFESQYILELLVEILILADFVLQELYFSDITILNVLIVVASKNVVHHYFRWKFKIN